MDPALYKDAQVSRGLKYHYFYQPATPGKPTLLFIHGFPSSSYDWHRQVEYLRPKGYGLLVPDLLGAGETSKPDDPEAFRMVRIARDIVDLLDVEGLDKVVGIAHDWGSVVLSRLANLFPDRFYAFAWLVVSYAPPNPVPINIDAVIGHLKTMTGNGRYGYWKWFNEDDTYLICDKNLDSMLQLAYAKDPAIWLDWLTPVGKTKEWVEGNRQPGIPDWLTPQEYEHMRETMAKGSFKSYLNYYKVATRSLNVPDDKEIPQEAYYIRKPALFIGAKRDAVAPPDLGRMACEQFVPHAKIVEFDTGHWVQLQATEQVNKELEEWIEGLGLQDTKPNL
ncbi:alpha/beta-hydrolase [Trametes coccinea BRFM310]|uniref:Alpha/beta-hydrolase n=1 Tax=Trametes coccinea (strain BRFM310) TaxID=1353009 RepID=A0A1Y2IE24_TRAC3|nr:alpha/beta-hydrolase [Trametes coccinea BRFM310]